MKKIYTSKEFAHIIGVNVKTLKRWHDSNKLVAKILPNGRRYYIQEQVDLILGVNSWKN